MTGEAAQLGLGVALEMKAIGLALPGIAQLSAPIYVAVNASPSAILEGHLAHIIRDQPLNRVMLEVTEHAAIEHYEDIAAVLEPLRKSGLRVAVDDAGAGYASFRYILSLAPDVIKLDISITRNIDTDRSRRALASALIGFAKTTHSTIVAEGVETAAELQTLKHLGVDHAQGYFLGRPMSIANAARLAAE